MDAYVLREDSCITWVPMYCMNHWHVLHNRVACNTCLKERCYMRHCPIQHAQHTRVPCSLGSKCRYIESSLPIPHTRGHSRGLPCKGRFKASYSLSHIPYSLTHFHCRSAADPAHSSSTRGLPCTACCAFTLTPRPTYSWCA